MKPIKILHVASFAGNIGDNASHMGLSFILNHLFGNVIEERLEIRRFYKNYSLPDKLSFDESFVNFANSFDLLIIGGGGFLDYWVPNSATGTTFDISKDNFDKLIVPTLICSVGCIPHRTVPEGNEIKFQCFLSNALSKKNVMILLRNDGSKDVLLNKFGDNFVSIPTILDNGFFFNLNEKQDFTLLKDRYIAVNSTLDQLEMIGNQSILVDKTIVPKELSAYILSLIHQTDYHVVFVPHIYSDIKAFQNLLSTIDDFYIRTRIHIAPYTQGNDGCRLLFSIYNHADYCVGMRYHANVCNLAMNKPVSGLAVLDRIKYMHEYVGNSDSIIDVSKMFSSNLFQMTLKNAGKRLPTKIFQNIEKEKSNSLYVYEQSINQILK